MSLARKFDSFMFMKSWEKFHPRIRWIFPRENSVYLVENSLRDTNAAINLPLRLRTDLTLQKTLQNRFNSNGGRGVSLIFGTFSTKLKSFPSRTMDYDIGTLASTRKGIIFLYYMPIDNLERRFFFLLKLPGFYVTHVCPSSY